MRRGTDIFAPRMSFAYFSAVRPSRNSLRRSWSSLVGDCQPLREHLSPLSQVIVRPFSRHGRVFPARPLSPGPGKGNASVGALHTDVRRPRSATLRPPAGCASRRRTRLERAVHPRRAVVPEHGTTRAALPDLLNHLGRVPLPRSAARAGAGCGAVPAAAMGSERVHGQVQPRASARSRSPARDARQ